MSLMFPFLPSVRAQSRQRVAITNNVSDSDIEQAILTVKNHGSIDRSDSADSRLLCDSLRLLAEASKTEPAVRTQLADLQILRSLLEILTDSRPFYGLATSWLKDGLRCVGNACNSNDTANLNSANAARRLFSTILGFAWILSMFDSSTDDEIKWLLVKVLYNICASTTSPESEAAARRCYEDQAYDALIAFCAELGEEKSTQSDDLTILIDLLFCITNCRPPPGPERPNGEYTVHSHVLMQILSLPSMLTSRSHDTGLSIDVSDLATLAEINLTYLRDPIVQAQVVALKCVDVVWRTLLMIESTIKNDVQEVKQEDAEADADADADEARAMLKPLSKSLMWCLSDLAAQSDFKDKYPLDDRWTTELVRYIEDFQKDGPSTASLTSALQVLGNLCWALPSASIVSLVTMDNIQNPVWRIVVDCASVSQTDDENDLLHSAAGFLRQLTRASNSVRDIIGGDENAVAGLSILCESSTPQIKEAGVKLLRALGKECVANQRRFAELARRTVVSADDVGVARGSSEVTKPAMPDSGGFVE